MAGSMFSLGSLPGIWAWARFAGISVDQRQEESVSQDFGESLEGNRGLTRS